MIRSRAVSALLCTLFCTLLALAACDTPTDVGGELINRPNVAPERVELPLEIDTVDFAPTTGTSVPGELGTSRFLAGQVTGDHPLGNVEAKGYVDLARAASETNFSDFTLDSAELQLVPDYFYGDTTQAATFALHDLTEDWEANGASADTSLAGIVEREPITTFSVPSDDTLTVALPDSWVREHADAFESASDTVFAENFHGFQIRPTDGNSVVGFSTGSTSMQASYVEEGGVETPQVTLGPTEQLTTIRSSNAESFDDRYVIQGGTGRALRFDLALGENGVIPDSLRNASINDATLIFEVASPLDATDPSFVRPRLEELDLYSDPQEEGEEPGLLQARLTLNDDSTRYVDNFPLRRLVQDIILGTSSFERFQLRPPLELVQTQLGNRAVPVPSLSSALIRRDAGHRPRLVITYTPTEE